MKKYSNNPTQMIKCTFSNAVHKILEPNIDVPNRERWRTENRNKYKFTDEQKLEMFDEILKIHHETSNELTSYQYDKRWKKRIHADRVARGYKFKTKTKKEDLEKNIQKDLVN